MKFLGLALVVLSSTYLMASDVCKCRSVPSAETTRWGGNEAIVIQETKSYPLMRGVVRDLRESPMGNVLVEVFDHPESLLLPYPKNVEVQRKQKRIAACKR